MLFDNLSDNDKNYLTTSLIYGSIERSSPKSKYDWWYWKRYYNLVLGRYKTACAHCIDMLNLRYNHIYPEWNYTCKPEEAKECYDYIVSCSDENFIDMVERIFHIYDTHCEYLDDRKPYQRWIDTIKELVSRLL